jgi:DNA repair protein REV1
MAKKSTIIHIDLDCFFVSVVIKNRLELHDKPVAVCHSDNPKGTAEISSANYPARAYGLSYTKE